MRFSTLSPSRDAKGQQRSQPLSNAFPPGGGAGERSHVRGTLAAPCTTAAQNFGDTLPRRTY